MLNHNIKTDICGVIVGWPIQGVWPTRGGNLLRGGTPERKQILFLAAPGEYALPTLLSTETPNTFGLDVESSKLCSTCFIPMSLMCIRLHEYRS